jgi:hypothetical protein
MPAAGVLERDEARADGGELRAAAFASWGHAGTSGLRRCGP